MRFNVGMYILEIPFFLIFIASAYRYLDAPVERVTGLDIPIPYAPKFEVVSLPQPENIVNVVRKVLKEASPSFHIQSVESLEKPIEP